jgi:hypothetical protein
VRGRLRRRGPGPVKFGRPEPRAPPLPLSGCPDTLGRRRRRRLTPGIKPRAPERTRLEPTSQPAPDCLVSRALTVLYGLWLVGQPTFGSTAVIIDQLHVCLNASVVGGIIRVAADLLNRDKL